MPKLLDGSPRWLDYSTPGFDFFQDKSKTRTATAQQNGSTRKIAHRGNEIFFAVGKELRWAHVNVLKEAGEYKVLTTPVPADRSIQQISISPEGSLIAVLTSHTCHVCILPPREHLDFPDQKALKLKYFTVGETAHVLEKSPLVSAIWHPLSPSGNGLVTVTKDACVRLWELDQDDRSTFSQPTVAVDLKKLANATCARDDLTASKYGTNKGYSADDFDMLVAGACFGGEGREDEDGWSSMTLWVAMTEGDVYALCPFLPENFWAPSTLLPSLTTSVVAKSSFLAHDQEASEVEKRTARQQEAWLQELDEQDPISLPGRYEFNVYSRPQKLSSIAKLQGPFQLSPEPLSGEITDIHVIAPKVDQSDLFEDEDFDELAIDEGLSIGIVCLATSTNQVHVCLNVEGVEAEWLPSKRPRALTLDDDFARNLLLFETVDLAKGNDSATYPTFTASPTDRYELYTTQPSGIYGLSFKPWIGALEGELAPQEGSQGIDFRLDVILNSASTIVDHLTGNANEPLEQASAAVAVLDDADADYIVLTSASSRPFAAVLDKPAAFAHGFEPDDFTQNNPLVTFETRTPYVPADAFFQSSRLPAQIESWRRASTTGADQGNLKGHLNFSPYTLQKITTAHQIMANETHALNTAAGDLFRRVERMLNEMKDQIAKVRDLSNRVNSVTGEDEFPQTQRPGDPALVRGGKDKIQKRVEQQREKTRDIQDRVERLRRKMRTVAGKEMSEKEKLFAEEVERIQQTVLGKEPSPNPTGPAGILQMESSSLTTRTEEEDEQETLQSRYDKVQTIVGQLKAQAEQLQKEREDAVREGSTSRPTSSAGPRGVDYRQRKMQEVWQLLERETALVEAVSARLENLQMGAR
ncbi:Putative nucleoporin NUP88/NUP82 [Septoria linicola]|uniref:Nucleoporin NUP88/NUP82 n=1 Tax=Septoria linicola TaxID=215465 RepID=A0A9Q9AVB0_9PEZI|nr:putative nucleoporin NUP88/NUP82 [Septoria linicola]USW52632.1 Putative nucleoporin NUP88/NUP82 [Septoria linicola]